MRVPRFTAPIFTIVAALALLAAACGKEAAPPAPVDEAPGEAQEETAREAAFPLDETFWYAGFKVDLGNAIVEVDEFGTAHLRVEGTFQNLGPESAYVPADQFYVDHQGTLIQFAEADVAEVPAGATTKGSLSFIVDQGFDASQAILYAGSPDLHQAVVPLGVVGTLHDCAPSTADVAGTFRAGNLEVTITGAELRAWSFPFGSDGQQAPAGTQMLALTVDVVNETDSIYGANVMDSILQLELPDGSMVVPENSVNEVVDPGGMVRDVSIEFRVPDPATGDYVLTMTEESVGPADDPVGIFEFTIR